ncbi:MAG: Rnase Y domain-containing protein, partial [Muribaculaceae bacterium]|nr:Rnase Y domain-containing protein [Muribaculaceae bacterium]
MDLYYILICVAIGVIAAAIAVVATIIVQRSMANTRAKTILADAEREAEDLKRNKVLQGREEALQITADAEKQANHRMAKMQSAEAKIQQRELQLKP